VILIARVLSIVVGLVLFSVLPGAATGILDPTSSMARKLGAYMVLLLCLSIGAVFGVWALRRVRKSEPPR